MDFDSLVQSRASVRSFSGKKPDWRAIIECVDAARYIPRAGKDFTMKFIILKDKEKIQKISDYAEQDFFANVHYLVAVYSDPKRLKLSFGEEKAEIYSRQQAGAAIQTILLALHNRGLSGCWVGHYDEEEVKKLLKIPDEMELEAVIPVGYEFNKTKLSKKIDMDNILFFDEHKKKKMKEPFSPET